MRLHSIAFVILAAAPLLAQKTPVPQAKPEASKAPMVAEWRTGPTLNVKAIRGTLVVMNHSDDSFDETVIVEAVNQIGKAFALGYQHFTLPPRSTSPPIPFDTTLPPGTYTVHADAVAEVATRNLILRQHLEVHKPFVISQL